MKLSWRRWIFGVAIAVALVAAGVFWFNARHVGVPLDNYKGVIVYDNGPLFFKSHGRHYSSSGYYWGQKWQCVEFVKRFYDQARQHQMPDVWGHAKDFFDEGVAQGGMNGRRGLRQFRNGGEEAPTVDDLLVFGGGYGHGAIVCAVEKDHVEVVQQNIFGKPREKFPLEVNGGKYTVAGKRCLGWLRK